MLLGLILLTLGATALIPVESWVHRNLHGVADTLAEHVYLPAARTLLVIVFLYCVFPQPLLAPTVLAGVGDAADLSRPDWHALLNVLFIAGALLPLLPRAERFGALILPLQTLIGAWIFIHHFEASHGLALKLNHSGVLMLFIGVVIASHMLLHLVARELSARYQRDALSLYDALALITQPPLALIVTRAYVMA